MIKQGLYSYKHGHHIIKMMDNNFYTVVSTEYAGISIGNTNKTELLVWESAGKNYDYLPTFKDYYDALQER